MARHDLTNLIFHIVDNLLCAATTHSPLHVVYKSKFEFMLWYTDSLNSIVHRQVVDTGHMPLNEIGWFPFVSIFASYELFTIYFHQLFYDFHVCFKTHYFHAKNLWKWVSIDWSF